MDRYRIEVGHNHEVKPGNIVGAIANEADIESKYIGRISIYDDHSTIDLPENMPKEVLNTLKKVWVSGQQLKISIDGDGKKSENSGAKKPVKIRPEKQAMSPQVSDRQASNPQTSDSQASKPQASDPRVAAKRPKSKAKGKVHAMDGSKGKLGLKKRAGRN